MRPHQPKSPAPGSYPTPPMGPRPAHGNMMGGSHTQLSRPAAPVPPNVPGLNRAKMEPNKIPQEAASANNLQFKREPAPPSQLAAHTTASRYDRSHMYKQATKLPDIKDGINAQKPKPPRRLVSIDGNSEPVEGKELRFPAIPGATEAPPPPVLQPIPRVRPMSPKGHTYQPHQTHHVPAPPANPKKQVHRVRPLHSQLQKVSSLMDAGPRRAPTPIESASYDPPFNHTGPTNMSSTMNGVHLDLPSPVNAPSSHSTSGFQTAAQERVILSPSNLGTVSPTVSASKSNKALDETGAKPIKPHPPKDKAGSHGAGGGARRRHYRL